MHQTLTEPFQRVKSSLRCVDIIVGKSSHGLQLNRYSGCQKCSAEPRPCQSAGLTRRGRRGPAVAEHCVLCPGSVVCFFPVCCKGPLRVRGEHDEWRSWDPLHSWEEAPPIESTEAECSGARQDGGLKALSLVHCLRVAPGFLATRSDCSEPARREKESTKALVFLS